MSWAYRGTLTADHTQCGSADSSSFPTLVSVTHASLKSAANGGQIQHSGTQSGGVSTTIPFDLVFSTDSAGSAKIPWEFESWDATNGIIIAWVQIPTLSHTADTVFYCLYGDSGVSTQQNTGSYSPANVWDTNFFSVNHFPNGSSLSLADSTSTDTWNTNVNALPAAVSGLIGGAASFPYYSAYGTSSITGTAGFPSNYITISFWLYIATAPAAGINIVNDGGPYFKISIDSSSRLAFYYYNGGTTASSSALSASTWYFVTATVTNGVGGALYLNASSVATVGSGGIAGPPNNANILFQLGTANSGAYYMDELQISKIGRSASWITSEYNNQKASSTFLSASFASIGSSFVLKMWESMSGGMQNLTGGMNG